MNHSHIRRFLEIFGPCPEGASTKSSSVLNLKNTSSGTSTGGTTSSQQYLPCATPSQKPGVSGENSPSNQHWGTYRSTSSRPGSSPDSTSTMGSQIRTAGQQTELGLDLRAAVHNTHGGNTRATKTSKVEGGDARAMVKGGTLRSGDISTSIVLPPHQPQPTIIFPHPQHTQKLWGDSAFGPYLISSVSTACLISVSTTLLIFLMYSLCRTSIGSKAQGVKRQILRGVERLGVGGVRLGNSGPNRIPDLEAPSKGDLALAAKSLNDLIGRTAQIEANQFRMAQLLQTVTLAEGSGSQFLLSEPIIPKPQEPYQNNQLRSPRLPNPIKYLQSSRQKSSPPSATSYLNQTEEPSYPLQSQLQIPSRPEKPAQEQQLSGAQIPTGNPSTKSLSPAGQTLTSQGTATGHQSCSTAQVALPETKTGTDRDRSVYPNLQATVASEITRLEKLGYITVNDNKDISSEVAIPYSQLVQFNPI